MWSMYIQKATISEFYNVKPRFDALAFMHLKINSLKSTQVHLFVQPSVAFFYTISELTRCNTLFCFLCPTLAMPSNLRNVNFHQILTFKYLLKMNHPFYTFIDYP